MPVPSPAHVEEVTRLKSEIEGLKNFRTSATATIEKLQKDLDQKAEVEVTNKTLSDQLVILKLDLDDEKRKRLESDRKLSNSRSSQRRLDETYGSLSRKELEEKLFAQSEALVAQAEKNQTLASKLNKVNDHYASAKDQLEELRTNLLRDLDSMADPKNYSNVQLTELLRLRLQQLDEGLKTNLASIRPSTRGSSSHNLSRPATSQSGGLHHGSITPSSPHGYESDFFSDGEGNGDKKINTIKGGEESIELKNATAADKEIMRLKKENETLQRKLSDALSSIQQTKELQESLIILRDKNDEYANRIRLEKDNRARANSEVSRANEKVTQLSEHIEKLMVHLKYEAAAKVKANATVRKLEKEGKLTRQRIAMLSKGNAAKDRVIAELKEGSRILEDQLRLMDEKYIELRNKLDWTRNHSKKEVTKIQKEANELRKKWLMAGGIDNMVVQTSYSPLTSMIGPQKHFDGEKSPSNGENTKKGRKLQPLQHRSNDSRNDEHRPETSDVPSHLPWSEEKLTALANEYE